MRFAWIVCWGCLSALPGVALAAEDPAEYELHDVSLWLADLAEPGFNTANRYASALPATLAHSKRFLSEHQRDTFRPWGLITFWGKRASKLDLELRIKKGEFLGYWLPGEVKGGRLQWSNFALQPDGKPESRIEPSSLFHAPRSWDVLTVVGGSRRESFLGYDCQLEATAPVKLASSGERYQVENTAAVPVADVLVFLPNRKEGLVGFIEELPAKPATATSKPAAQAKPGEKNGKELNAQHQLQLSVATKAARATTRQRLGEHWRALGLTADEAKLLDEHVARIFDQQEMLVLCRMPAAWSEERLRLLAFPEPRKTVRVALVLVRNANPAILDDARRLVGLLGSTDYRDREMAEQQLIGLGQLALPAVKQALDSKDAEVIYRAERVQQTIESR